jgi:putative DNA primase/helicase
MTYAHDQFQHSPLLLARSATKRCGKSTLVSLLAELVHRPMPASNLTPAVIFRVVEEFHPTLLIDEVDSFLEVSEEMRGILNSGHQRGTAMVYRIEEVEGRRQIIGFSTWAPKLLAMIGRPPSTILDRSISIHMRRKLRGDKVEKRRHAALDTEGMRSRCARWAGDNAIALAEARPEIPDELNDRQADSWEPLLAIAERAGRDVWRPGPRGCGGVVLGGQGRP